jgi:hypothetical protein
MKVTVEIIVERGNYAKGARFEIEEQVARQLVASGIARITSDQTTADLVTESDPPKRRRKPREAK